MASGTRCNSPPGLKGWGSEFLALGAGALLPLAFAPFNLWPLALLAPAALFLSWNGATPGQAARRGYLFGLGLFGVGVSWVYVAIHVFGETPAPLAGLLTLIFVLILALYQALLGYLAGRLGAKVASPALRLLLLWPALWLLIEWFRGWFLSGFPWLSLGYSLIDTPLGHLAPLLGVLGMSLVAALSAGGLALLIMERRRAVIVGLVPALVLWGGSWALAPLSWTEPKGEPLKVSLVQGNQPQIRKWDGELVAQRLDTYATLSRAEFGQADVVVWPENAVTIFYHELAFGYFDLLGTEAREARSDLVLGVPLEADGDGYYTTLMSLGSHQGFYRKRHLVPFGEFVPLQQVLRGLIGFFDLPMSSFIPGPDRQPPLLAGGHRLAASICYEDAFGVDIAADLPEASLLVNGSNNAWYGDSLAPHQHLQISRMRALETGRPMLRATTNGISALIDSRGAVIARSPQFKTWVLRGEVQPMEGVTPYVRWKNWPVLLLMFGGLAAALAGGRQRGWLRRQSPAESRR